MTLRFALSIFLFLLLASCKSTDRLPTAGEKLKPRSAKFLVRQLAEHQVAADWFSGRLRIDYRDPFERTKFNVNLRMRRDSVVWMNIKKVSVEAARVQITPDSIYIINRLDNQYLVKPTTWLREQFGANFTFEGLQQVILGNPVFFTTDLEADIDDRRYVLEGRTDHYFTKYYLDGLTYRLRELFLRDERERGTATIEQSDYQPQNDGQLFPIGRRVTMDGPDGEISMDMEWSKVEIDEPKKIIFSIPPRYERVDRFVRE